MTMGLIGISLLSEQAFRAYLLELENFYSKRLTDLQREAYRQHLGRCRDMSDISLRRGVIACIGKHSCDGRFFPSAEKLIEYSVGTAEERVAIQNQKALQPELSAEDNGQSRLLLKRLINDMNNGKYRATPRKTFIPDTMQDRQAKNEEVMRQWEIEGLGE